MIIAMTSECYFPPHRHKNKSESFHMIEGELFVILFKENGEPYDYIYMTTVTNPKGKFFYRINLPYWHAVMPITPMVVFHETTNGPFLPNSSEFAHFAPTNKKELVTFLHNSINYIKIKNNYL